MSEVVDAPRDLDVPDFDPDLHIAPAALLHKLRCVFAKKGASLQVFDMRTGEVETRLRGAEPLPEGKKGDVHWSPTPGVEVVLIDEDGSAATEAARAWRQAGYENVRALYGGMRLYEFSLDVEVVGERYL